MKCKVFTTYRMDIFEQKIEGYYAEFDVKRIDTHTDVKSIKGDQLVHYTAVIFYDFKDDNLEENKTLTLKDLKLPVGWENKIVRHFSAKGYKASDIKASMIVEMVKDHSILDIRNIGSCTYYDLKELLEKKGLM